MSADEFADAASSLGWQLARPSSEASWCLQPGVAAFVLVVGEGELEGAARALEALHGGPPVIAFIEHGSGSLAASLAMAQELLALGADDVAHGVPSVEAFEREVAIGIVRATARRAETRHTCLEAHDCQEEHSEESTTSTAMDDLSSLTVSESSSESSSLSDLACDGWDRQDTCLALASGKVDCGVNTEDFMFQCIRCSRPPRPLCPAPALRKPSRKPRRSSPKAETKEAQSKDHLRMNEFDGVWEASAVDGRPVAQSRLNPIFISMEIADGKATLADGSIAQVELKHGVHWVCQGQLRLENGVLVRRGRSGTEVCFSKGARVASECDA